MWEYSEHFCCWCLPRPEISPCFWLRTYVLQTSYWLESQKSWGSKQFRSLQANSNTSDFHRQEFEGWANHKQKGRLLHAFRVFSKRIIRVRWCHFRVLPFAWWSSQIKTWHSSFIKRYACWPCYRAVKRNWAFLRILEFRWHHWVH